MKTAPARNSGPAPRPRGRERSERDVVVRSASEIVANRVVGRHGRSHLFAGCALAPAAQHLDVLRHDLGREALLSLLVLPLTRADAAFDVDLPALGEVLADDLRLLAPHHHAMPLRGLLLLATLVGPSLGGRDAEVGDR